MQTDGLQIGTRVRVRIKQTDSYAMGAAAALDGKRGIIETVKRDRAVVRFDTPAKPWWTNQLPVTSFWFDADELSPA